MSRALAEPAKGAQMQFRLHLQTARLAARHRHIARGRGRVSISDPPLCHCRTSLISHCWRLGLLHAHTKAV